MSVEPCNCERAGWCTRHQLTKEQAVFDLCKEDDEIRAQWDKLAIDRHGPGILKKGFNFTTAVLKQAIMMNPTRSQEEIDRIASICHRCPSGLFNGRFCTHGECGCPMDTRRFFAALAFETKHCPLDHWKVAQ